MCPSASRTIEQDRSSTAMGTLLLPTTLSALLSISMLVSNLQRPLHGLLWCSSPLVAHSHPGMCGDPVSVLSLIHCRRLTYKHGKQIYPVRMTLLVHKLTRVNNTENTNQRALLQILPQRYMYIGDMTDNTVKTYTWPRIDCGAI